MANFQENVDKAYTVLATSIILILIIIFSFGFGILSLVAGTYDDCNKELSEYLIVHGSLSLVYGILNIIHKAADVDRSVIMYIVELTSLGVAIWGMVIVWPYQKDPCSEFVYHVAFVASNLWWWLTCLTIVCKIIVEIRS